MNKSIQLNADKLAQINLPSPSLLTLVAVAIIATTAVVAFQKNQEVKASEIKSVAWYAANQKEAKAQNKICFDQPELQTTENCVNSLHALEMSYKGTNG